MVFYCLSFVWCVEVANDLVIFRVSKSIWFVVWWVVHHVDGGFAILHPHLQAGYLNLVFLCPHGVYHGEL